MKPTLLALLVALAACHHDKPATTTPVAAVDKPAASVTAAPPAPPVTDDAKVSPTLALAGDIIQQCGIKATASAANPKFDYDKDELAVDDRNVLDQLAACLMTGPLKGKPVMLIGRADPRGTQEYNLGLGSRRSATVHEYLKRLGVGPVQLFATTRGAVEATGTDEAGWAADRRVDIQLKTE